MENTTSDIGYTFTDLESTLNSSTQRIDSTTTNYEDFATTDFKTPNTQHFYNQTAILSQFAVTANLIEQVITATILATVWLYVNSISTFLIYVIKKTADLSDNPHFILLAWYMLCDILICNAHTLQSLPVTIMNDMTVLPHIYCRIFSTIGVGVYLASVYILGYLGLERYVFFRFPLKYTVWFSKKIILITSVILSSIGILYSLVLDIILVRQPVYTTKTCLITEEHRDILNPFTLVVFFAPSAGISIFTLIALRVLISQHQAKVTHNTQGELATHGAEIKFVQVVKKNLKMLVLISGTLWFTIIPGFVIRSVIFSAGITWEDTDRRDTTTMFVLANTGWMMMTVLSSVINPIIYLSLLPQLRNAARKTLGLKTKRLEDPL